MTLYKITDKKDFMGKLLGPGGNSLKRLQKETGAKCLSWAKNQ